MNAELKRLAKLFPPERPLYAVGGCVRDEILGREVFDIEGLLAGLGVLHHFH